MRLESALAPTEQNPRDMGLGNTDESLRFGFCQAGLQVFDSKAGIDQDRNRTGLEKGKGQREKIGPGGHHQHAAHPPADAVSDQTVGDAVGERIQLAKGEADVALGKDDGRGIGLQSGHLRKVGGNVDETLRVHGVINIPAG